MLGTGSTLFHSPSWDYTSRTWSSGVASDIGWEYLSTALPTCARNVGEWLMPLGTIKEAAVETETVFPATMSCEMLSTLLPSLRPFLPPRKPQASFLVQALGQQISYSPLGARDAQQPWMCVLFHPFSNRLWLKLPASLAMPLT